MYNNRRTEEKSIIIAMWHRHTLTKKRLKTDSTPTKPLLFVPQPERCTFCKNLQQACLLLLRFAAPLPTSTLLHKCRMHYESRFSSCSSSIFASSLFGQPTMHFFVSATTSYIHMFAKERKASTFHIPHFSV